MSNQNNKSILFLYSPPALKYYINIFFFHLSLTLLLLWLLLLFIYLLLLLFLNVVIILRKPVLTTSCHNKEKRIYFSVIAAQKFKNLEIRIALHKWKLSAYWDTLSLPGGGRGWGEGGEVHYTMTAWYYWCPFFTCCRFAWLPFLPSSLPSFPWSQCHHNHGLF